jgi:hypothetical protein
MNKNWNRIVKKMKGKEPAYRACNLEIFNMAMFIRGIDFLRVDSGFNLKVKATSF